MKQLRFVFCGLTLCLLSSLALLTGCSSSLVEVDSDTAQEALVTVMESWKEGKAPDDLLDERPSITVQETDWNDEIKLLEYHLFEDSRPAGPNLVARVKLKLSKQDGAVIEKTATYVIATSPKISVYRNLMK